jgi:Na+-driven multidrug efflux pump
VITGICSLALVLFPQTILQLGTDKQEILDYAAKMSWILILALGLYSFSAIYFNGLVGTGATGIGLLLQVVCVVIYLIYVFAVNFFKMGLNAAWASEFLYWILIFVASFYYLRSRRWEAIDISKSKKDMPADDISSHFMG